MPNETHRHRVTVDYRDGQGALHHLTLHGPIARDLWDAAQMYANDDSAGDVVRSTNTHPFPDDLRDAVIRLDVARAAVIPGDTATFMRWQSLLRPVGDGVHAWVKSCPDGVSNCTHFPKDLPTRS